MYQIITDFFNIPLAHWTDFLFLGLGCLTLIAWIIQLVYYFYFNLSIHRYKKTNIKPMLDPVSVIICANNEADNLKKNLPEILGQFYPEFQVIVVNDGSKDDTPTILAHFQNKHPHLYVTTIEHTHPYPHAKKLAQTIGIKAAKYDQLLFIDPDCRPIGPNWIRQMQSNFLVKNDIVLGYGAFEREKKLVNLFLRTDTVYIAQQYLSYAIHNMPFMGVGRNLAYRKSFFMSHKGYANQLHLQSGEEDLFVNQHATSVNTAIEMHPESITRAEPYHKFRTWLRQKRRNLLTWTHYRSRHKFLMALDVSSRLYFYVSSIVLLSFWHFAGYVILLLLFRLIMHLWIFKLTMRRLQEKGIWLFSLIFDFIMPFISGTLMIRNRLRKNKKFVW